MQKATYHLDGGIAANRSGFVLFQAVLIQHTTFRMRNRCSATQQCYCTFHTTSTQELSLRMT